MCQACQKLQAGIDRAHAEGDEEKARVLEVLLHGHRESTCAEKPPQIAVEWANNQQWVVAGG